MTATKDMLSKASKIVQAFFLISLLPMPFSIQKVAVEAASETVVKVEPHESFAGLGENFTINVTVVNVQNLYGVEVALYWNASVLRVVNIDVRLNINESHPDGVLYTPIFWLNETSQEQGNYLLFGTSTDPAPPFNGSGNIVRIAFNVTAIGNCTLDLETKLADWPPPDRVPRISQPIPHTTIDGFFEIPEFPQLIILMLFMILITFAIILSKKRFSIKLSRGKH